MNILNKIFFQLELVRFNQIIKYYLILSIKSQNLTLVTAFGISTSVILYKKFCTNVCIDYVLYLKSTKMSLDLKNINTIILHLYLCSRLYFLWGLNMEFDCAI